jgi:hypothetical protein
MECCGRAIWSLMGAEGFDPITFAECGDDGNERVIVPGISAVTNPAEALRLACLAAVSR